MWSFVTELVRVGGVLVAPPRCPLCQSALRLDERTLCRLCMASLKPPSASEIDVVVAAYEGAIRRTIQEAKFNGASWRLGALGRLLGHTVRAHGLDVAYVVPVPTTSQRLRERGYNPAALVAKACALSLGVPAVQGLRRVIDGDRQHTLSREDRARVRRAFEATGGPAKGVLVVDDVTTTGHTLLGAADTLRAAGYVAVHTAAVAHTPRRESR